MSLEEKLKNVKIGSVVGLFAYFLIGLTIKSSFYTSAPEVSDFYELLRDGLTITAYYLAPAAAIVLFSDWRKEHIEKSRESQGKEIYDQIIQIYNDSLNLRTESEEEESFTKEGRSLIFKKQEEIQRQINKLEWLVFEFDYEDEVALKFKTLSEGILGDLLSMNLYLGFMFTALLKLNNPEEFIGEYVDESIEDFTEAKDKEYEDHLRNFMIDYTKISKLRKEAKILKNSLKVQIKSPN